MDTAQLLSKAEIKTIEEKYPEGISSGDIVKIFQSRGIRFSEATFRKYVQMGLVERCKRVGQKGKHRGSHGLYPIATVERINAIKRLIDGEVTLAQLQVSVFHLGKEAATAKRLLNGMLAEAVRQSEDGANGQLDKQALRLLTRLAKDIGEFVDVLQMLEEEQLSGERSGKKKK